MQSEAIDWSKDGTAGFDEVVVRASRASVWEGPSGSIWTSPELPRRLMGNDWAEARADDYEVIAFELAYNPKYAPSPAATNSIEGFMNWACEHLPEGWSLRFEMERGAGWAALINPEGFTVDEENYGSVDRVPTMNAIFAVEYAKRQDVNL
jgi:hypothetical protein